jgi:hypothetical protein
MTAMELARKAKTAKPHIRYAAAADGASVGGFDPVLGRFAKCAYLGLDGNWYSSRFEILVDGKPVPTEWVEV